MKNINLNKIFLLVVTLSVIFAGCSTGEKPKATPSLTETPEEIHAVIKSNKFTSNTLGIEMELPGSWFIHYKSTPDEVYHRDLISKFDSTITKNDSQPKLIYENGLISFMIEKDDESSPDLQFIAAKDEIDEISLEQVIDNLKNSFSNKDDRTFNDLPDIVIEGITIKRFKVSGEGYVPTMHAALRNGYTIIIACSNKYESDYSEMAEIISSIKTLN